MDQGEILAKAFWSRGRKTFLPLTMADAANRLSLNKRDVERVLFELSSDGLVQHRMHKTGGNMLSIWTATEAGKKLAMEFAK